LGYESSQGFFAVLRIWTVLSIRIHIFLPRRGGAAFALDQRGIAGRPYHCRSMPVHNADIGRVFDEIADLLEIQEANPFRVRAYRNGARTVENRSLDLAAAIASAAAQAPGSGTWRRRSGKSPRRAPAVCSSACARSCRPA
jgi:hypothetical protein